MSHGLLLDAPDPSTWLEHHLAERFGHEDAAATDETGSTWFTHDELLADDGRVLRETFDRLATADQLPPQAAATFVAFYVCGLLAEAVGFTMIGASGGLLLDPASVRWRRHREGYFDRIDLGASRFIVPPGHPWSAQPEVQVAGDLTECRARTVASLVETSTPIIDACRRLAKVGRAGLWNEVGDGLGMCVAYQTAIAPLDDVVAALHDAVRFAGAPWKSHPTLRIVRGPFGPTYVAQKGGCCLAYTKPDDDEPAEVDDDERAYFERFPHVPGEPHYCSTCSLRDPADCEARQLFFLESQGPPTASPNDRPTNKETS